jgi:hypothetical protein
MNAGKGDGRRYRPPSLNSVPTELDKLYEDGGPAKLASEPPDKRKFKPACDEYPLQRIAPLLRPFCKEEAIRPHWPWIAFALSTYIFEIKERNKYSDERTPKQWEELLQGTAKAAYEPATNLEEIQAAAHRLADPSAPLRRAHIAWFDDLFAKAAAGRADSVEAVEDSQIAVNHLAKQAFLLLLVDMERSAILAVKNLDPRLLTRKRGRTTRPWITSYGSLLGRGTA